MCSYELHAVGRFMKKEQFKYPKGFLLMLLRASIAIIAIELSLVALCLEWKFCK